MDYKKALIGIAGVVTLATLATVQIVAETKVDAREGAARAAAIDPYAAPDREPELGPGNDLIEESNRFRSALQMSWNGSTPETQAHFCAQFDADPTGALASVMREIGGPGDFGFTRLSAADMQALASDVINEEC